MIGPLRTIASFAALAAVACSKGEDEGAKPASPKATAPPPTAPETPDEAIVAAKPPADVAGSFLAGCSTDTSSSYVNDETRGVEVSACVVLDAAGKIADANAVHLRTMLRGEWVEPPEVAKEAGAPWQVGVKLPIRDAVAVERWELNFKTADGTAHVVTTDSGAFDWRNSLEFATFISVLRQVAGLFGRAGDFGRGFDGELLKKIADGKPAHLAFLTSKGVRGNVGLENADALCTAEGGNLMPGKTWRALLSTSTAHARDRVPITADRIYNYEGNLVDVDQKLYSGAEHFEGGIKFTADGFDYHAPLKGEGAEEYSRFAWTATTADGNFDPETSCADWTSDAPDQVGRVGDVGNYTMLAIPIAWPCSRLARLVCISLE